MTLSTESKNPTEYTRKSSKNLLANGRHEYLSELLAVQDHVLYIYIGSEFIINPSSITDSD